MPNMPDNVPEDRDPRRSTNPDDLSEFEEATGEVAREGPEQAGDELEAAEHRARRRKIEQLERLEELTEEPVWEDDEDDSKEPG